MSSTDVAASSSTTALSIKEKMEERKKKLYELHLKRNEARMLNHKEVIEEDKRNKLPANWEARKRKAEWIQENEKNKHEARERGENYDRIKLLNISAEEAASQDRRKKKKNPDQGFSDYQQATLRQYNRLVKNIKPDLDDYSRQRERLGEAFYGGPNTILQGLHKDTSQGIDRMVDDLEKQIERREKYSRRRTHNDDADIDYINDRNMKFNKKLERFYGQYTTEIKQNLERGTAV